MCATELIAKFKAVAEQESAIRAILVNEYSFELQITQQKAQNIDIYIVSNESNFLPVMLQVVEEWQPNVIVHERVSFQRSQGNSVMRLHPVYSFKLSDTVVLCLQVISVSQAIALEKVHTKNFSLVIDKDQTFTHLDAQKECLPDALTEASFKEVCHYFWHSANYVAKALYYKDLFRALEYLNIDTRQAFHTLLRWYLEINTQYQFLGEINQLELQKYIPLAWQKQLLKSYDCHNARKTWQALYLVGDLFRKLALEVADHYDFSYDYQTDLYSIEFCQSLHSEICDSFSNGTMHTNFD